MLTLFHGGNEYPIQNTEYFIRELASGLDEVSLDISIYDPIYAIIQEEETIVDRAGQKYLVKQIDAGADSARIICQLDLDEWKNQLYVDYDSGTKTCAQQIDAVKPTGWTLNDRASISIGRTIKGSYTAYEICVECTSVYGAYIRWDNKTRTVTIYPKTMPAPIGAFATRELNLKEINYKGKSNNLITRLYAYGKDGLSFASINNNKPYVDNNTYNSRVICGYWQDDRYTDKASLLADAQEKLAQMAIPQRSYSCSIVDLQATNPDLYNNLDFSLFKTAVLIDDIKNSAIVYQVVERHIYPYHPESNEVIFDNSPIKITQSLISVEESIENPNSTFQQIQAQRIADATNWLISGDGYVVAVQNADGSWKELLFMDTDDIATAHNVLRINTNGIGFSHNGVNGPYTNAWTIDGNLVADFITTGTLTANLIKAGILGDAANKNYWNMETGDFSLNANVKVGGSTVSTIANDAATSKVNAYDTSLNQTAVFNKLTNNQANQGIYLSGGQLYINASMIKAGTLSANYINGGTLSGMSININNNFTVDSSGNMTAKAGYIGNGSYGFKIANTYIANKLTSVGDTSQDGAYYGINGMAVNAAGKHSHVMGSEIVTQGTLSAKGFTIGDNGGGNTINGRFDNTNGMTLTSTPDNHYVAFIHTNGGYVPITNPSDRRFKENIQAIDTEQIRDLFKGVEPVQFNYKWDKSKQTEYGLIAQDFEEVLEAVGMENTGLVTARDGDENNLIIMYHRMVGLLIPAVKDLYERVEALEEEIRGLKQNG